jgi:hypothetical protein
MNETGMEITLPSGRMAVVRKGTGRDLMRAHRAVAANPEPIAVSFALVAELAQVEGKPIVYEDMLAMELADVLTLQAAVMGEAAADNPNFPSAPATDPSSTGSSMPAQSSDSSASASPSRT